MPTFDERIDGQRAIEEVYWRHRIWPDVNPRPKPPFSEAVPGSVIREKVENGLRMSNALEAFWSRPIGSSQLQAEMERMARDSRDPAMLKEIFEALGNDPQRIAECLARPVLAERQLRDWYAQDGRFHADLRTRIEDTLARGHAVEDLKRMGGAYAEIRWREGDVAESEPAPVSDGVTIETMDPAAMNASMENLRRIFAADLALEDQDSTPAAAAAERAGPSRSDPRSSERTADLPVGRVSSLQEDRDEFFVTAILGVDADTVRIAKVTWRKVSFESWWASARSSLPAVLTQSAAPPEPYGLVALGSQACANDSWQVTRFSPLFRADQTAVWTGTEMIVWGGLTDLGAGGLSAKDVGGGRYNPATDTWTPVSVGTNASIGGRHLHTAVWTGTEMIVWGGIDSLYFNTGGRYDPSTDTWRPTSVGAGAPTARARHTAVWTGNEMIVWGGVNGSTRLNTGARYSPSTDTWTAMGAGPPQARERHTAVWTGNVMIVCGGYTGSARLSDVWRYDPAPNTWTPINPMLSPRSDATAIWTGTEMIVWGGFDGATRLNTGGRYNPSADTWAATSTGLNTPSRRDSHTAVWTGTEMIVWGGTDGTASSNTGGRYAPGSNTWASTDMGASVPSPRNLHTAVWTGSEMIVWGGFVGAGAASGGRYSPASHTWSPVGAPFNPSPRSLHAAVWTGSEMIVYGGQGVLSPSLNTGARYDPAIDVWTPTLEDANNQGRSLHTALWTGTEMIVWGGSFFGDPVNSGSRYNPVTNSWLPTSVGNGVPDPRYGHSAVWTGTEMIVWGGNTLSSGGRYNPVSNTWTPTSLTGAPTGRGFHQAVWTGSKMIVWGGFNATALNTGGRYDPATDGWSATSVGPNVPDGHSALTAQWTGSEMIVWGGGSAVGVVNTGGRYNPLSDSWRPTSVGPNVPPARSFAASVWTGREMIVWGGSGSSGFPDIGGRYDPSGDFWLPTSTGTNRPSGRFYPTAVATGSRMIVWGGGEPSNLLYSNSGGLYCYACTPTLWYRDADGDAFGNGAMSVSACGQPSGYSSAAGDCNDSDPAIYPGAPERNDGADNQCPGEGGSGSIDEISGVTGFLTPGDKTTLSWPPQLGASSYDVARSPYPDHHAGCRISSTSVASFSDPQVPPVGSAFFYLVRAASPRLGSWGQRSSGAERTVCAGCSSGADQCDDANGCTVGDACSGTVCVSGVPPNCDDGNPCTNDSCNPATGCAHVNNALSCNDGNACTTGDACTAGICQGGAPLNCDDGNPCTDDSCNPSTGCVHANNSAPCSDGNACTTGDACTGGICQAGAPANCSDGNPCTDDSCSPASGCVHANNSAPCSDGNACTTGDTCTAGVCQGGAPPNCSDGNPCTDDSCNTSTGCAHANNSAPCSDGNACTTGDTCTGGICQAGAPANCSDGNPCTDDSCSPASGCAHTNNTSSCDDGSACTTGDVCSGGLCAGTPLPAANHLVISQIQTSGDGASPGTDEFIEIYNPTSVAVNLSNWSLQRVGSTSPFMAEILTLGGGTIPAHGWFLVAPSAYNGTAPADRTNGIFVLSSMQASILLVNATTSAGSCSGATVVDKVGYGSALCSEGSSAPAPSANNAILRRPGGSCGNGTDSGSNAADFVSQIPSTPRNTGSPPQP